MDLLPHQTEGVDFLVRRGCGLLAFEQGLGKTATALAAFVQLRAEGLAVRLFVVCPNSLKRNWAGEVEKFFPELSVAVVEGAGKERKAQLASARSDVLIINYEAARAEVTMLRSLISRGRSVLLLDESHAIKNSATISHIAAKNLGELASYRWLLTGTPYTNSVEDLYGQLTFLDPSGRIGPKDRFLVKYGNASEEPRELRELLSHYMLRRTKAQCLKLPAKLFEDRMVELPDWQAALYARFRGGLVSDVRAMTDSEFQSYLPNAMARLLRLWQVASNPALVDPAEARTPAKFAVLDALLAEAVEANGLKVIVWSSFVKTIDALAARYAGRFESAKLHGGVPSADRAAAVRRFQENPQGMAIFANPAVAATGFTMTASRLAVYETMSWRYDFFAQSQDRNHRIGQTSDVTYVRLIAQGTVDEQIVARVERKARSAAAVLDGGVGLADEKFTRKEFLEVVSG